jgi:hypothetical protein
LLASAPVLSHAQTGAPTRPQHAILLVIDGLSYLAPERVEMPHLKALTARGAYFRESYSVVPQHPHSGEWAAKIGSLDKLIAHNREVLKADPGIRQIDA